MKLAWVSDIHLNFLEKEDVFRAEFYTEVIETGVDAVVVTGDIAESHNVVRFITEMQERVGKPIYFVLGNHDFYGSSLKEVKESVKHLHYLPKRSIELSSDTILVGVDGWGDTRNGDYEHSRLTMNDWIYIDDLRQHYGQGMAKLKKKLMQLADSDALKLKGRVLKAIEKGYKKIIIATHVPPFEEVCLNAGKKSTPCGLPFFSSQCLGTAILPIAKRCPNIDFLWLSGHTHSRAKHSPCNNMKVKVANADYYRPKVEEVFNI